jgi:hypothetical protein
MQVHFAYTENQERDRAYCVRATGSLCDRNNYAAYCNVPAGSTFWPAMRRSRQLILGSTEARAPDGRPVVRGGTGKSQLFPSFPEHGRKASHQHVIPSLVSPIGRERLGPETACRPIPYAARGENWSPRPDDGRHSPAATAPCHGSSTPPDPTRRHRSQRARTRSRRVLPQLLPSFPAAAAAAGRSRLPAPAHPRKPRSQSTW